MANRWFGPRPLIYTGIDAVVREVHGSCGCCGCGGYYSTANVSDFDGLFLRYAAYRDGLRMKVVIADVPDSFAVDFNTIWYTEASGMSGYNGTWYFDMIRTQYGCIFNATDSESFDVTYRAYSDSYDLNYIQRVSLFPIVNRDGPFLNYVAANINHYSPDYFDNTFPTIDSNVHPMIGIAFEPTNSEYNLGFGISGGQPDAPDGQTYISRAAAGWDSNRLTNLISGDLRFYLSEALINQDPMSPGFTNAAWNGTGTFWDSGTNDFKVAGTFTAEIERL